MLFKVSTGLLKSVSQKKLRIQTLEVWMLFLFSEICSGKICQWLGRVNTVIRTACITQTRLESTVYKCATPHGAHDALHTGTAPANEDRLIISWLQFKFAAWKSWGEKSIRNLFEVREPAQSTLQVLWIESFDQISWHCKMFKIFKRTLLPKYERLRFKTFDSKL